MARLNRPGAEALYSLHDRWIREILPGGGSILPSAEPLWTLANLEDLTQRFIDRPDLTKDKKFLDKLRDQLTGASPAAVQLMAELHVIHFLHIAPGAISAVKKRSDVEAILSWMPAPAPLTDEVIATFSPGLIHPGQWVLSRRDTQLTWLIRFSANFLRRGLAERQQLLDDPWAFKEFVALIESQGNRGARLAMMHMTHPDTFEPIVSMNHKRAMVDRFATQASADSDVDRRLLALRQSLVPIYGDGFSWYDDSIKRRWDKPAEAWRPFLEWIQRLRVLPSFDQEEREYKFRVADHLREARRALLEADVGWVDHVRKAISSQDNNLTSWRTHTRFLKWLEADPDLAGEALTELWRDDEGPPWERLRSFLALVPPDVLGTRGERLNLGSFLLMAEGPERRPPLKISALRSCLHLLGWPSDTAQADDADVYRLAMLLFEEIQHEGSSWHPPLRDVLDAQGAAWGVTSWQEPPEGWPDELWQRLLDYRETELNEELLAAIEDEDIDEDEDNIPGGEAPTSQVDHLAEAAADLHVDREVLDEVVELLEDKGQVVLYGPPGTGKTYFALRLARAIAQGDEKRVALVQFHPATSYEDFIEGLRPRLTEAGHVTYEVVAGPLVRAAERARRDPDNDYVLVVDEINRANLPKVFGELLFLLEYRNERAHTIHRPDQPFSLPKNLWLIGTMNTADRSIALIDAAMRRRFHFVPFFPHQGPMRHLLRRWLERRGGRQAVADLLDAVNAELLDEVGDHLLIGPSHFMRMDLSDAALERIWTYNVFPLIEEQFWGDRSALEHWTWEAVRSRFASVMGSPTAPEVDGAEQG